MSIRTTRHLLTSDWTADVARLDEAIGRLAYPRGTTHCLVSFFEVERDGDLHVNVTHRAKTQAPSGWSGPGVLPEGFVHNRTFGNTPPAEIIKQIRAMVFAARA